MPPVCLQHESKPQPYQQQTATCAVDAGPHTWNKHMSAYMADGRNWAVSVLQVGLATTQAYTARLCCCCKQPPINICLSQAVEDFYVQLVSGQQCLSAIGGLSPAGQPAAAGMTQDCTQQQFDAAEQTHSQQQQAMEEQEAAALHKRDARSTRSKQQRITYKVGCCLPLLLVRLFPVPV